MEDIPIKYGWLVEDINTWLFCKNKFFFNLLNEQTTTNYEKVMALAQNFSLEHLVFIFKIEDWFMYHTV